MWFGSQKRIPRAALARSSRRVLTRPRACAQPGTAHAPARGGSPILPQLTAGQISNLHTDAPEGARDATVVLTIAKCQDLGYYEREVIDGREDYLSEAGTVARPMGRRPRRPPTGSLVPPSARRSPPRSPGHAP